MKPPPVPPAPARRQLLLLLAASPALSLAQPAASAPAASAAGGAVVEVTILDYKFTPAQLSIMVGTTVRWLNQEKRTTHSVLFTGTGGFESERFFPGESWQRRFDKPGRYEYTCGPHPEMKGLIDVQP